MSLKELYDKNNYSQIEFEKCFFYVNMKGKGCNDNDQRMALVYQFVHVFGPLCVCLFVLFSSNGIKKIFKQHIYFLKKCKQ